MKKTKFKTMSDREMENKEFRKYVEETEDAFQLEVQILKALEEKHLTYADLARKLGTDRCHISRDLKGGGIRSATLSRITKMAKALGMKFIPLMISEKEEKAILPKLAKLIAA